MAPNKTRRKVLIGRVSLSTAGAAYLLGINRRDTVVTTHEQDARTCNADLEDPSVICIAVGNKGDNNLSNFCRYNPPTDLSVSAAVQAFDMLLNGGGAGIRGIPGVRDSSELSDTRAFLCVANLVRFIDQASVRQLVFQSDDHPTLWDVFGGMRLLEHDPLEQLHKGVELLKAIVESAQDPFGPLTGFDEYAAAKTRTRLGKGIPQNAAWDTTNRGLCLCYLESPAWKTEVSTLYARGARIAVFLNPSSDKFKTRKIVVTGKNIRVDAALPALNALEPGWGGPETGSIIGSRLNGTSLSLRQVVEVVKSAL